MDKDDLHLEPVFKDGRRDDLAPGLSRRSFFMAAGAAGVGGTAALLGATAARAADQLAGFPALTVLRLPSSSPAYTLALAEKQRAWQALAEAIVR